MLLSKMPAKNSEAELMKAAKKGDTVKLLNLLVEVPTLVHYRDATNATALHYASWNGHLEAVELLVEGGADVNAQSNNDHYGTTPLHAAAHANHAEVAEFLLSRDAENQCRRFKGQNSS